MLDVIFCMEVTVKVVLIDSLQKSSALLVAKMKPELQVWEGKPLPKTLKLFVNGMKTKEGNFSTLHLAGVNLANEMSLIDPDLMAQSLNKITFVTLFVSSVSVNQVWQSL